MSRLTMICHILLVSYTRTLNILFPISRLTMICHILLIHCDLKHHSAKCYWDFTHLYCGVVQNSNETKEEWDPVTKQHARSLPTVGNSGWLVSSISTFMGLSIVPETLWRTSFKTVLLPKYLCLAQSEVTDQNDPSIATTLRPYSRTRGTMPSVASGSLTPLLHLPTDDEPPPVLRR